MSQRHHTSHGLSAGAQAFHTDHRIDSPSLCDRPKGAGGGGGGWRVRAALLCAGAPRGVVPPPGPPRPAVLCAPLRWAHAVPPVVGSGVCAPLWWAFAACPPLRWVLVLCPPAEGVCCPPPAMGSGVLAPCAGAPPRCCGSDEPLGPL